MTENKLITYIIQGNRYSYIIFWAVAIGQFCNIYQEGQKRLNPSHLVNAQELVFEIVYQGISYNWRKWQTYKFKA